MSYCLFVEKKLGLFVSRVLITRVFTGLQSDSARTSERAYLESFFRSSYKCSAYINPTRLNSAALGRDKTFSFRN